MNTTSTDCIEKRIELKASIEKVWHAISDYKAFGQWFRLEFETPFVPGKPCRGRLTYPGYENLMMEIVVKEIKKESLFSFHWHPFAVDKNKDYSHEPPTLVEFKLEKIASGTLLIVTESGFDALPSDRRDEAFRMNDGGWIEQMKNIEAYVDQTS